MGLFDLLVPFAFAFILFVMCEGLVSTMCWVPSFHLDLDWLCPFR